MRARGVDSRSAARPRGSGALPRGSVPVDGVGPDVVVVDAPALDDGAGFGQEGEDLLVQALVPQPAVEALDEAVLLRPARRDVVPGDASAVGPSEDRATGHLGPIVADDHGGTAATGDEACPAPRPSAGPRSRGRPPGSKPPRG